MAKKKTNTDDIFSQLIEQQNKIVPHSAESGDQMFAKVSSWNSTGSCVLDTIISNKKTGGWPGGRTVELYGQESIGKSTLIFSSFAQAQKEGGIGIYFDAEQAGSEEMMKNNGVDLSRLIVSNLTSIEEIFAVLEQNLNTIASAKAYKGKPVVICMDSLAQMTTDAELESGYDFNMNINLKKAMQLGKALRKIVPYLNKANASLIIINQLRDAPGVTYGDPTCVDPYSTMIDIEVSDEVYEKYFK
jgi:recombination protein RecA